MTRRPSAAQKEHAMAAVRRLSLAGLDEATLLRRVARAVHRAVPFTFYSAATIDPASNLIAHAFAESVDDDVHRSVNPGWFDHFYFAEGFDETIALMRNHRWATTIGEATRGKLEQSLCFRESMRPGGITDKIHTIFVDRGLWGDMELYRDAGSPPFSEDDVDVMRRIAPDVGAGLKQAALRARAESDGTGESTPGVLVIDSGGRVTATPAAVRLLSGLGDLHPRWRDGEALPVPVRVVLSALGQSLADSVGSASGRSPQLHARTRAGQWLTLHAAMSEGTDTHAGERIVVISPAQPRDVAWLGMAAYDLSPREEEVVNLVVSGKSTRQISDRLFIAEHTVQRHLSNIFEKVGVRSRRALVKHLFVEHYLPGVISG